MLEYQDLKRHTLYLAQSARNISKIFWTYLHLSFLDRVAATLRPIEPAHSFTVVLAVEVQSIQVGMVTTVVPPGAFIKQGTACFVFIVITILGGKWHTAMTWTKCITSSSYKKGGKRLIGLIFLGFLSQSFSTGQFHLCISNPSPLKLIQTGRSTSRVFKQN